MDDNISSKKRKFKKSLWYRLRGLVESNPYSWYFAWNLIHNLPFLLPHDKIYLAIRHFHLTPGDLILDVGANDGISALSFFHIDSQVRVFSIEPNAIHGKGLERIKKRHASYNYRIVGAGSAKSSLTLFTPRYHFIYLHTFTSSNESQVKEAVIEVFGQQVGNHLEMIAIQSEIIALDDLALAPKVIKIDVEGFEHPVLQGLKTTIMKYRPFLIIETCHDEGNAVVDFIKELNYVVLDYDYKLDKFQELGTSSENMNGNRNNIVVPIEKLSTLPFRPSQV